MRPKLSRFQAFSQAGRPIADWSAPCLLTSAMKIRSIRRDKEQLMSRNFIPYLGLALGAAMIPGTPATAYSRVTEAVVQQSPAQGTGSPTTEPTTRDGSPSTAASSDLGDRIEQAWAANKDLADAD